MVEHLRIEMAKRHEKRAAMEGMPAVADASSPWEASLTHLNEVHNQEVNALQVEIEKLRRVLHHNGLAAPPDLAISHGAHYAHGSKAKPWQHVTSNIRTQGHLSSSRQSAFPLAAASQQSSYPRLTRISRADRALASRRSGSEDVDEGVLVPEEPSFQKPKSSGDTVPTEPGNGGPQMGLATWVQKELKPELHRTGYSHSKPADTEGKDLNGHACDREGKRGNDSEPAPETKHPAKDEEKKIEAHDVFLHVFADLRAGENSKTATSGSDITKEYITEEEDYGDSDDSGNLTQALLLSAWKNLVLDLLMSATKELFLIRPCWIRSSSFLQKALRNSPHIDILQEVKGEFLFKEGRHTLGYRSSYMMDSQARFDPIIWCRKLKSRLPTSSQSFVIDPQSPRRMMWALFGMLLMVYDLIMLPMQVYDLPRHWFLISMSWLSQLFWTGDMVVSGLTSYYVNGELEMQIPKILKTYAITWMPLDAVITLPLWVILLLGWDSSAQASSSARSVRYIRMLRFLRLARVVKFESLWSEAMGFINSASVLLSIGMVKLMFLMLMINHIVACVWYAVGMSGGEGWANREQFRDSSILYRYLSSLHWSMTQFQGTSDITPGKLFYERFYAVGFLVTALFILASFISSLTNRMMQWQNLNSQRTYEQRVVRGYLSNHEISHQLSVRIKKYLEWKQREKSVHEYDQEVFNILPLPLMMDLLGEVRVPCLICHSFFAHFHERYPRIVRRLCHDAMTDISPMPGELVFSHPDTCIGMYFVVSGSLAYEHTAAKLKLKKNDAQMGVTTTGLVGATIGGTTSDSVAMGMTVSRSLSGNVSESREGRRGARANINAISGSGANGMRKSERCADLNHTIQPGHVLAEAVLWTYWHHAGCLNVVEDASLYVLDAAKFEDVVLTSTTAQASALLWARHFVAALNQYGKQYSDFIQDIQFQELILKDFDVDDDSEDSDEDNA